MADKKFLGEKSFELKELIIISSDGKSFDVYPQLVQISIFEDIYNSTMSGEITLSDSVDLMSILPLNGFNFIGITVLKPGYEKQVILEKIFRIYKMTHNGANQTTRSNQMYTLHFCSEENLVSLSRLLSKSYKGKTSSDIIKDILLNQVSVSPRKYNVNNIESSSGRYDIIIPNINPLQAASWVATRTISSTGGSSGAAYMFFENRNGYNFKSLETLFMQKTKVKYRFKQKNIDVVDETLDEEYHDVIKYEHMNVFDTLKAISLGMFSSVLKAIDLVRLRADDTVFNYNNFFNNSTHINNQKQDVYKLGYQFQNEFEDRLNNKVYENFFANRRMYPTNKDHDNISAISSKQPGIKPNFVEKWMLQRISQIQQLNYLKLKLVAPGDVFLTVGDVIEFDVPSIKSVVKGENNINPYYSGRYLITAIRHKLDYQNYEMIMEVTRDCLSAQYPNSDNTNPGLKEIKKS